MLIRGLNASAVQGFETTTEGLEPYHDNSALWLMDAYCGLICSVDFEPDISAVGHVSIFATVPTCSDHGRAPLHQLKNNVDPDGKHSSSSSWHGWTFRWRWSSDATTRRSPKLRFHLCSSRMLCSIINNSLLKLRPTSTNFNSSRILLHLHLTCSLLHHQNLHNRRFNQKWQHPIHFHLALKRWSRSFEATSKRRWRTLSKKIMTHIHLQPYQHYLLLSFRHNHY